jgi:muconolactone delta-isomerase
LCVLCEMVRVTHSYNNYSILKRHERDKLKTLTLSLCLHNYYSYTLH